MGSGVHPDEQLPSGGAAGIRKMFEAEAQKVEAERRASSLMFAAFGRMLDRMLTALNMVNLAEWRERKARKRQSYARDE